MIQSWLRLKATAEIRASLTRNFWRRSAARSVNMISSANISAFPGGGAASLFTWDMYERATRVHVPLVRPGAAFDPPVQAPGDVWRPATFNHDDPSTWPVFKPLIIAHDVGRSHDRSTAVVGGNSPFRPLVGAKNSSSCRKTCSAVPGPARWRRWTAVTIPRRSLLPISAMMRAMPKIY